MDWTIETVAGADVELVRISGDFDLYEAPRFASVILAWIREGSRHFIIDMKNVHYLDSSGIGVIIRILQAVAQTGGEVWFRGIEGPPRKVLEMSNVISLIREWKGEMPNGR